MRWWGRVLSALPPPPRAATCSPVWGEAGCVMTPLGYAPRQQVYLAHRWKA